jgi:hypothetical protein
VASRYPNTIKHGFIKARAMATATRH